MVWSTAQPPTVWALAREQHGVIARRQLRELGASVRAIEHRLARGRLYRVHRGVYAVGRAELTRQGEWMAAVLACGASAVLSHHSAAAAMGVRRDRHGRIDVSVVAPRCPRVPGIRVHRRRSLPSVDLGTFHGIPITSPIRTLLDLAPELSARELEAAVNEADKLDLVDVEALRGNLDARSGHRGVARLRDLLDRHSFRLTDSELERCFLRILRRAGLPLPLTRQRVNGYEVDLFWPELGLVVETDGLRYHRTPAQQAADRRRDQAHAAAGLASLRFTHRQVRFEQDHVERTLVAVARRLSSSP